MTLLAGIIGAAGEPQKISTSIGNSSSGNTANTSLTLSGAVDGQLQIVCHFANLTGGGISTPPTPTNFTSLYTFNGDTDSLRISYRIYSSTVSTISLPTISGSITEQVGAGFMLNANSGFSFTGLGLEINSYSQRTASAQSSSLSSNRNDIATGVIWSASGEIPISGTVADSYGAFVGQGGGAGKVANVFMQSITQTGTSTFNWTPPALSHGGLFIFRPTFS